MNEDGGREARARRSAARLGLALRKDRARSVNLDHQGGYMVVDPNRNWVIAGERYDLDITDVELFLKFSTPTVAPEAVLHDRAAALLSHPARIIKVSAGPSPRVRRLNARTSPRARGGEIVAVTVVRSRTRA